MPKGVIHADVNEHNVIVRTNDQEDEVEIVGLIDLGDVQYNALVFDLAIAMMHAIASSSDHS